MNGLDCTDIKALLSALIDDQLDEHSRHQVERHLADCEACRSRVNEHERLDAMISMRAELALHERPDLPRGFESQVLARTVRAEAPATGTLRGAVTWTGWFAAAASIALAVFIWLTDQRQPAPSSPLAAATQEKGQDARDERSAATHAATVEDNSFAQHVASDEPIATDETVPAPAPEPRGPVYQTGANLLSSVFEGAFNSPDELLAMASNRPVLGDPQHAMILDEWDSPRHEGQHSRIARSAPEISREEADAIYNIAVLMHVLADADLTTFADIERVRRVVMADDLIDRLGETRERVDAADRPALLAAESVLVRIVEGPLDHDDVRLLSETVARLDLPGEIGEITDRWDRAHRM